MLPSAFRIFVVAEPRLGRAFRLHFVEELLLASELSLFIPELLFVSADVLITFPLAVGSFFPVFPASVFLFLLCQ